MNTITEATNKYSKDFPEIWYYIRKDMFHEFFGEIKVLGVRFYTGKEVTEDDIGAFMSVNPDLTTGYISAQCWGALYKGYGLYGFDGKPVPVIQLDYSKLKKGEDPILNIFSKDDINRP